MRFAYHEIHFITITGLPTAPNPKDIVGYRLTSLGDRVGDFECSSELISTMYSTTVNNYRGLTTGGMSVDCPHRERRGYGGDGHTSYQFALANYPVGAFFNKWTRDFADVQGASPCPHQAPALNTQPTVVSRLRSPLSPCTQVCLEDLGPRPGQGWCPIPRRQSVEAEGRLGELTL